MMTSDNRTKRVAILGGSGFTGAELYRLLNKHPFLKVDFVSSESKAGVPVEKYFTAFTHTKKVSALTFKKIADLDGHYDLIFSCLPKGALPRMIEQVAEHTDYIFNVSGDYRFSDPVLLQKHYPDTLNQPIQVASKYYIPEFSEIDSKVKVVNLPGCMAVATIYSLYPLLANELIENRVVTDAKTGSSGGGKSSSEHHAERANNFRPHSIHGHRHRPEIEFAFEDYFNSSLELQFTVHSLDLPRGILVTSYSVLKEGVSEVDVKKAFYGSYAQKPFIHYFNSKNGYPMIKTVAGTNYAEVGVYVDGSSCVSIASIDNLIKGAAGQAIQAANLYLGFPEETGLQAELGGVWP
ncbi:N-acetyl-gamma-glutamyl-phosphate reductase [Paenibacillus sp. SYP-B3998]|uniref:N-acetyl-gamma-glutamyl-phosphate reductase n=1 Tax=Paenibacillus sp. SYP-B3998 TaxID=2678564 RepID=A0A6G3ZX55_9BACL|nr:N-acetyl-gamma-glutamyl-phosphate reductase [Paenibacillus sp. SYP-B3998]NEW06695.1 N-acetyl-gamma-glutamyl-phosphate reductase [Paenibacillus sp. SYP-B3998]